jgi:hypothetical protein
MPEDYVVEMAYLKRQIDELEQRIKMLELTLAWNLQGTDLDDEEVDDGPYP